MAAALILVADVFSYLFHFKTTFPLGPFALFDRRSTDYKYVIFYRLKLVLNGPINGARGNPEINAITTNDYKYARGR